VIRSSLPCAALALVLATSTASHAADQDSGAPEADAQARAALHVRATPIFGDDATTTDGWTEIAVNIENVGGTPRKGTVEVVSKMAWSMRDNGFVTHAPFNVVPGRSAVVKLPVHGFENQPLNLTVTAKDESGAKISSTTLPQPSYGLPLLVDVHQPSRLAAALRSWPISVKWNPASSSYYGAPSTSTPALSVGVPTFDRTTGDPILPDHAAGYANATCVLMPSDVLAKLEAPALDALVSWVISGGTLAVVPARVEDLRGPAITALVGGSVVNAPPPPVLMALPGATKPSSGGLFPSDPLDTPDPADPLNPPATPLKFEQDAEHTPYTFIRVTPPRFAGRLGPSPAVRSKLSGYSGGNLAPSVFGASAAYGLGEVHLLAFDPSEPPMADDPWVHGRMVELLGHAWDRRSVNAFSHGGGQRPGMNFEEVRRALDPNENFRLALGIAAILLVLYSIVAGPVTFLRAAKKGTPLAPLKWVPIFSAITFGAIVLVGLAGKGWRGRGRHISLVETGAGVSRGAIRRFRGFFTSESRSLSIAATDQGSLLKVAGTNDFMAADEQSALKVDRNGATLENITSLPWQTIVVQEDGFHDFKGGVSVLSTPDGSVDVINHTGKTLKDVMVYVPADGVRYFDQLAEGAKVHGVDGNRLAVTSTLRAATSFTGAPGAAIAPHALGIGSFTSMLGAKKGDALRDTWQPLAGACGQTADWWPDVPVVMAEVEGGEGQTRDSGLSVESDRMLLRVVGRGGAP
jgi:hypothetical protein